MTDLLILGVPDAAAAPLLAAAAAQGLDAAIPPGPVWSVVPGFRADCLGPSGPTACTAPRILAVSGRQAAQGGGMRPDWRVPRLLRAAMAFDPARAGWMPVRDAAGQTSIPGLAAAETVDEALAILAATPWPAPASAPPEPPPTAPDAVVCPCEGLTQADILAAAADGARDMNQLRAFTRCGMGQCQGEACEDAASVLLAGCVGGRVAAGQWTVRPPLLPLPLDALVGQFTYADIPVPPPAPL